MNGQLPRIGLKPLQRPAFTTTRGCTFEQWVAANDTDLRSWYEATTEWAPEQHPADWQDFLAVQFDIEQDLDERFHDALYEVQCVDFDNDDEP